MVARRTEALQEVAKACADAHKQSGLQDGGRFAAIQLDVSDKAQVASLFDKVPKELRDIDILGEPTVFSARGYSLTAPYSQQRWLCLGCRTRW